MMIRNAAMAFICAGLATLGAAVAHSQDGGSSGGQSGKIELRNTVTGEFLNLDDALPEGKDTDAVKYFLKTGENPYRDVADCLPREKSIFLTACSGCHGHTGEGKIGPGLNDSYWTYPDNMTDKGMFATVFGGAQGQMGPQYANLTLDEMLLVTAWVRHIYKGEKDKADWLTDEQKKTFVAYDDKTDKIEPSDDAPNCKPALK